MKRALLIAIPVALAAFSVMSPSSPDLGARLVQDETVVEQPSDEDVSDEELKMYIDVYSAMQMDHSLTLEDALRGRNVTTEEFRNVERRVQNKSRLVAKVREALLEQATQRSAFSEPRGATPAETPTRKP